MTEQRLVVLISGRGSNLRAIHQACAQGTLPARVVAVIANRADAAGLTWCRENALPTAVVSHRDFVDRESFDQALAEEIDRHQPDWIVLAGFLRQLSEPFVRRYLGRLINIHPSLLPAFPGLHTHARALAAGVRWHGATVHFVTPELDAGPIISQGILPVLAGESAEALAERVLQLEHQLYPQAIGYLLDGSCILENGQASWCRKYPSPALHALNPEGCG